MPTDYFGIGCNQELVHSTLDSVEDLGRHFGGSSGECSTEAATNEPAANSSPTIGNAEARVITPLAFALLAFFLLL